MICPQCDKEMIYKEYSRMEGLYHWEDECNYFVPIKHIKNTCNNCKISCLDEKWKIPKEIRPTEKQVKAIEIICSVLNIDYVLTTKKDATRFISENIQKSKAKSKVLKNTEQGYEDYLDAGYYCNYEEYS